MTSEIANVERKGRNLVVNVVDCVDIGARKKVTIQYNWFIMFSLNYPVSMIFFPGPYHIIMPFPIQCPKAGVSVPSLRPQKCKETISKETSALRWLIRVNVHIASSLVLRWCINSLTLCQKNSIESNEERVVLTQNSQISNYGLLALWLLSYDWKYVVEKIPLLMVIINCYYWLILFANLGRCRITVPLMDSLH